MTYFLIYMAYCALSIVLVSKFDLYYTSNKRLRRVAIVLTLPAIIPCGLLIVLWDCGPRILYDKEFWEETYGFFLEDWNREEDA